MSPLDHVDDYPEIPISLASTRTALKTGAWRSVRPVEVDRTAPCAAGCPAGVGIPVYMHLVRSGRLEEAFAASVMFEDNALRQFRASQIGTPRPLQGSELAEARAQIWHPKVIAKMWHFYLMKGKADGVI